MFGVVVGGGGKRRVIVPSCVCVVVTYPCTKHVSIPTCQPIYELFVNQLAHLILALYELDEQLSFMSVNCWELGCARCGFVFMVFVQVIAFEQRI